MPPRRAQPADAGEVARLLHDFNTEFATPSPGVPALVARAATLLGGDGLVALLGEQPDTAIAVVSFRPNLWYPGPVALLDELYVRPALRGRGLGAALLDAVIVLARARGADLVEINVDAPDTAARRFYERHGFSAVEPDTGEHALYYWRELTPG